MKTEKILFLSLLGLFAIVLLNPATAVDNAPYYIQNAPMAAAAPTSAFQAQVTAFMDNVAAVVNPLIAVIVGDTPTGDLLIIKFLFLIIILFLVSVAAKNVPGIKDNDFMVWLLSLIVALLAVRFLTTPELVNFIWLPTGVLGVTFASLLPFILFFFFIEGVGSTVIRKVGWVVFTVLFLGLAVYRWSALQVAGKTEWYANLAWFYVIIAIVSLLILAFDKTIHAKFLMAVIEEKGAQLKSLDTSKLQDQLQKWRDVLSNPASTAKQVEDANKGIKDTKKKINALLRS